VYIHGISISDQSWFTSAKCVNSAGRFLACDKKQKNKKQSYCTLSASHVPARWPGIIQNDCCGPASVIQYLVLYRKIDYSYTTVTSGTYVRPSHHHFAATEKHW